MFRTYSLRFKLSVSIAALAFLILGTMTFLVARQGFKTARANAEAFSLADAHAHANKVQASIEESLLLTRAYSQSLFARKKTGLGTRDMITAELEQLLLQNPQLIGAWTGWEPNAFDGNDVNWVKKPGHDETGRYVPYWSYENGKAVLTPLLAYDKPGDGDFYLVPKERKKETLVEPYIYPVAGVPTLMTSAVTPILIDGEFRGVVGVDLGLSQIQSQISKIKPYENSESFLVTGMGAWVSHPKSDLITKKAEFPFDSEKILAAIKNGTELTLEGRDPADGKEYFYSIAPVAIGKTGQTWGLVIRTPTEAVLAAAVHLMYEQILISVVGLILLMGAVYLLARGIANSMNSLSGELHTSASEVTIAINQLTGAGQILSQSASESAASVEETVASLEEINSMVQMNSESANQAAQLSNESMTAAKNGEREVSELIEKMNEISKSSTKIVEIISVIDDIAFQTNLLALNAAVEAARAGEQGKGFAVVADAVRTLAQKSAGAAKDISSLIQSSVAQVDEGTRKAEASGVVLKTIVGSIQKVAQLNGEIAKASAEQAVGINQISTAMNQLDQTVQANASSAEEIAASSQEIDAQSVLMKNVVQKLNENIQGSSDDQSTGYSKAA